MVIILNANEFLVFSISFSLYGDWPSNSVIEIAPLEAKGASYCWVTRIKSLLLFCLQTSPATANKAPIPNG
jgi:hypothetical protein